jgi:hypothetical protein
MPIDYLIIERASAKGIVHICAYQRGIAYCDTKISFDWLPSVLIYIIYIVNKHIHTNAREHTLSRNVSSDCGHYAYKSDNGGLCTFNITIDLLPTNISVQISWNL